MQYTYRLLECDFLAFQLYYASHDKRMIKQRSIGRWLLSVILLFVGLFLIDRQVLFYGFYFILAAFVAYFIYPWYTKWFFKQTFKYNTYRNYKNLVPLNIILQIEDDTLEVLGPNRHQKVLLHSIQKIVETKEHYFIILRATLCIIVPKQDLIDSNLLKSQLLQVSRSRKLIYLDDTSWMWK